MLGMCLDKRVLAGLALVGVAVLVVAPELILAVLPLLLIAICPLSMLFMGKAMMGGRQRIASEAAQPIDASYRTGPALERDQQVALLQMQIQAVGEQQTALAQQLAHLQATPLPSSTGQDANDGARSASAVRA